MRSRPASPTRRSTPSRAWRPSASSPTAGSIVGEAAVLASGRRTASVVATSALKAIALFKRDVWRLEREAPEAARRLRAAFDERVAASDAGSPA